MKGADDSAEEEPKKVLEQPIKKHTRLISSRVSLHQTGSALRRMER